MFGYPLITQTLTQEVGITGCCLFDLKETHLKTNCFKHTHTYIEPRNTDTCHYVFIWIHSIPSNLGSGVQIPRPPPIWQ